MFVALVSRLRGNVGMTGILDNLYSMQHGSFNLRLTQLRLPNWQGNAESASLAEAAAHLDIAVMFFHDAVSKRKTESVSLPNRASGKERLENAREIFCGDTVAVISN